MELLNSEKTKLATIDETTAFVRAWGANGNVFGFYTSKQTKGEVSERKLTLYKVEALANCYIKTDSGKEIALGTDVNAIPEILSNVGITVGLMGGVASVISEEAIKHYASADTNDKASIDVKVILNLPSDATDNKGAVITLDETEVVVKFKRSINAPTVNDVLEYIGSYGKISSITSDMIIGASAGETGSEDTMLSIKDALLEDQTITLVWGKSVTLNWEKATTSDETVITTDESVKGSIKVPYTSTLAEAIELLKKDADAKKIFDSENVLGTYSKTSGKVFTKSELKKNVNTFSTDTIQIVLLVSPAIPEEPVENPDSKESES